MKTEKDTLRAALLADDALRRGFLSAASAEAAAEVAGRGGWAVTTDELRALREELSLGADELSASELESISGGTSGGTKIHHDTAKNIIGNIR